MIMGVAHRAFCCSLCAFKKTDCMPFEDLREFLNALEKQGELKRVALAVDPYLEITEFADRAVKSGGPALLFEKPKGSHVPVLINSFASARKMEIALQVDSVQEVAARISERSEERRVGKECRSQGGTAQ